MTKILGIGDRGCSLADEFGEHPEYRVYKIMAEENDRGVLNLGKYDCMEVYEKSVDVNEVDAYLRSIKPGDEVLAIVGGGEPISGAMLKILERIRESQVTVLYVSPDREMTSLDEQRNDKIAFNVLQQYARSGLFKNIILAHYPTVETLIGEVSIQDYEQQINYFISYAVAMVNFYKNSDSVMNSVVKPLDWSRISTLGVGSLDSEEVNFLFPLKDQRELHFYFGVPFKSLEDDQSLMKRIKEYVKSFKSEGQTVSFSVHGTSFEGLMVLCEAFTPVVQPLV
jgi:hypothetical protein